ncbi:MAG: hypothetical protein NUV82_00075 [Candidatus Komeilibacteria bacterium]|nr:hypothetical protein [Candidatus Komeilibacteria bacterium]
MYINKRRLFIIGGAALLLVLIIVLLVLWNRGHEPSDTLVNEPQIFDQQNPNDEASLRPGQNVTNPDEDGAKSAAKNFVERYFSFSNQNWGENINLLQNKMTAAMRTQAQTDLENWRELYDNQFYYGVSAKVLSQTDPTGGIQSKTLEQQVQLQVTSETNQDIQYASYSVELVKSGDRWLINSLTKK